MRRSFFQKTLSGQVAMVGLAFWAAGVSSSACSSRGTSAGDPDPDGGALGDSGCAVTLGGSSEPIFDQTNDRLTLSGDATYVELSGGFFDGPAVAFHEEAAREGACRLLTYEASVCDPACEEGDVCLNEECVSHPAAVSAGALTLTGIAGEPISVEPTADAQYLWSSADTGVQEISAIRVEAAGGDLGPFELETCVVEPLEPTSDWSAALSARGAGEDVTLAWGNPHDTARIALRMTTGIGTHGGISPVEIECEGKDTGSLTLPGGFLDLLYDGLYWSCGECGDNRLFRYQATEALVGGATVQLRTQSQAPFYFRP